MTGTQETGRPGSAPVLTCPGRRPGPCKGRWGLCRPRRWGERSEGREKAYPVRPARAPRGLRSPPPPRALRRQEVGTPGAPPRTPVTGRPARAWPRSGTGARGIPARGGDPLPARRGPGGPTSGISSVTMSTRCAGAMSSSLSVCSELWRRGLPLLSLSFFFLRLLSFSGLCRCSLSSCSFTYWSDTGIPAGVRPTVLSAALAPRATCGRAAPGGSAGRAAHGPPWSALKGGEGAHRGCHRGCPGAGRGFPSADVRARGGGGGGGGAAGSGEKRGGASMERLGPLACTPPLTLQSGTYSSQGCRRGRVRGW